MLLEKVHEVADARPGTRRARRPLPPGAMSEASSKKAVGGVKVLGSSGRGRVTDAVLAALEPAPEDLPLMGRIGLASTASTASPAAATASVPSTSAGSPSTSVMARVCVRSDPPVHGRGHEGRQGQEPAEGQAALAWRFARLRESWIPWIPWIRRQGLASRPGRSDPGRSRQMRFSARVRPTNRPSRGMVVRFVSSGPAACTARASPIVDDARKRGRSVARKRGHRFVEF